MENVLRVTKDSFANVIPGIWENSAKVRVSSMRIVLFEDLRFEISRFLNVRNNIFQRLGLNFYN